MDYYIFVGDELSAHTSSSLVFHCHERMNQEQNVNMIIIADF